VAILRYRLYDLDLVVKKTVVFTIVAAFITLLYVAALALATISTVGAIVGALIFVLTFNTVRRRARKVADRIVYGKRATPFEVMTDFSERVGETYSIDDVLPRMTELLTGSTGASEARVWLRSGSRLSPVASSPPNPPTVVDAVLEDGEAIPSFGGDVSSFPVTHQGELLGAITLRMPANDPMDPSKERLVHGLASQAGLVLRNVALVQDLRASRRRLVAAQDEERRRLERNIHDGAQQQLVAMSVKIRLAEQLLEREPLKARGLLTDLQSDTTGALEDLRDLARGIYPPLLADKGLPAALEAQARKAAIPIAVHTDAVRRYHQSIEATVYFCCLEAMQNIGKYAEASRSSIRLAQRDEVLVFEVADDGVGFDAEGTLHGSGLQGMADRLNAVGGTLEVRSEPGTGTTVMGQVPVTMDQGPT
jgi:signal transduction histidine kinase